METFIRALFFSLVLSFSAATLQAATPDFFGIVPGVTGRAEVDLRLELVSVLPAEDAREYKPPVQATDVERVIATFFPDTGKLARLDVYLKSPIPPDSMQPILGNRIITGRVRSDAGREDLYYPSLKALIFFNDQPTVAAIGFLSPRYLADIQIERFNDFFQKKEDAEAKVAADMAVLIAPGYSRGYLAQGLYFEKTLQNPEEAMTYYRKAAEAPDGRESRARALVFQGMLLWKKKDIQGAEERFLEALRTWEGGFYVHWDYGRFLWSLGRDKEAVVHLRRAFDLYPEHAKSWYLRVKGLYDKKEYEQAARHFAPLTFWLSEHPDNRYPLDDDFRLNVHGYHAFSLFQLKRDAEAEAEFRRALALGPDQFSLNLSFSKVLLRRNRYEEALTYATRANHLRPADSEAMVILAAVYASMNSEDLALRWLRAGIAAGYKEKSVLQNDRYFAPIRETAEFKRLLDGM